MSHLILTAAVALVAAALLATGCGGGDEATQRLQVSADGRYLVRADGSAFFWLGDTGWAMVQRLNRADVETYLENRRAKGFSVIQTAILFSTPLVSQPNAHGDTPFTNASDPTTFNTTPGNNPANAAEYDFWDHLDYMVTTADAKGLYVALEPTWGDKVGPLREGPGPIIFNSTNAQTYGNFLGNRYRNFKNVIWLLGGDRLANSADGDFRPVWRAMANGLEEGHQGRHLMTYHPGGFHSSSEWFHNDSWLDANFIQTWSDYTSINPLITNDYALTPVKPAGLGEGAYENAGNVYGFDVTPHVIRKQAYWSWLSGGYHTYGNMSVWHFAAEPQYTFHSPWRNALNSPGAAHLTVARDFFASFAWERLVPDQGVFGSGVSSGETLNVAARSQSGDRVVAYLSTATTVTVNMSKVSSTVNASWVNTTTGARTTIGTFRNR